MSTIENGLYRSMVAELVRGGRFKEPFGGTDLFRNGPLIFANNARDLPGFLRQAEADGFVVRNRDGMYSLAPRAHEKYTHRFNGRASPASSRPVTLPGFSEGNEDAESDASPADFNPRFMDDPDPEDEIVEPLDLGDEPATRTPKAGAKKTAPKQPAGWAAMKAEVKKRHIATLCVVKRHAGSDGAAPWLKVRDTIKKKGLGKSWRSIGALCGELVRYGYLDTLGNDNKNRRYRITDQGRRLMAGS